MRLGLDVGGTKISAILLDHSGQKIYYQRYETEKSDYTAFLSQIEQIVNQAKQATQHPFSIGIGLPGSLCPISGAIRNSNCLILNGEFLKEDLGERLLQEVSIANDADCFALSEALYGAGMGKKTCFGIIIGTGCGGGLSVKGELISGPNRVSGEWGHSPLAYYSVENDGDVATCYCGQAICNESFLSGTGFAARYNARHGSRLSSEEIINLSVTDPAAKEHYQHYVNALARAMAVVINILDPDVIVMGGGMSNVKSLYNDLPEELKKYVFGGTCQTPIKMAQLGDDSGVLGAAYLPE